MPRQEALEAAMVAIGDTAIIGIVDRLRPGRMLYVELPIEVAKDLPEATYKEAVKSLEISHSGDHITIEGDEYKVQVSIQEARSAPP